MLVPVRGRAIDGGPAVLERELLRHLPAAAPTWRFVYLAARHDPTAHELAAGHGGVTVLATTATAGLWWDQLVVPRIARRLGADVVFAAFSALAAAGPFARVLVLPGGDYFTVPEVLNLRNRLKWHLLRHLVLPRLDRAICLSERHRADVAAATGLPPERLVTVSPGISPCFRPLAPAQARAHIRARFGLAGPYLLFVGHLFPNKGLETALAALARIAPAYPHRLVVVGGIRWGSRSVAELARAAGVGHRVLALGPLPQEELPVLYAAADALLMPSRYESFGFAAAEALACGCPAILSTAGALPEVGGAAALYAPPGDSEAWAQRLRELLNNPALAERLRRAGPKQVAHFRWELAARRLATVLAEVVAARALPSGVRLGVHPS